MQSACKSACVIFRKSTQSVQNSQKNAAQKLYITCTESLIFLAQNPASLSINNVDGEDLSCSCNTGVGDVKSGGRRPCLTRPLLELVCAWLTKEPELCIMSLRHSQAAASGAEAHRASLWTSPTKPNMQTPVPGLIRWCTNAPLVMLVVCFMYQLIICNSVDRSFINLPGICRIGLKPVCVWSNTVYIVCSWQLTHVHDVL